MSNGTRYAKAGDAHIAYTTLGDGPIDLMVSLGMLSHIEHMLAEPHIRAFYDRLAEFSRLIMFDRRGVGLSDAVGDAPMLEDQADDAKAVMDAVGSERAAILGHTLGAPNAIMFAASHPERVSHLVLSAGFARMTWAEDYTWANTPEQRAVITESLLANWGTGAQSVMAIPSMASDLNFREWFGQLERLACGPGAARRYIDVVGQVDVRPLLPSIQQPTLVMHSAATIQFDRRHSEYLAEHIPNSTFVEVSGADIVSVTPESIEEVCGEIQEFLTGSRPMAESDRALRTVLFTDIVDSTRRAAELGDRNWRALLDTHDDLIRRELDRFRGQEIKTTGDGFFASFDGPERAVRCALSISEAIAETGVEVRSGLHTGECEVRGEDLGGMAVHIGARVAAKADRREVLVSQTVRDLVVGSDLHFNDRGKHELKGVPGEWQLFAANG